MPLSEQTADAAADELAVALADPALHAVIGGRPPTAAELRARHARWLVGPGPATGESWLNWVLRLRTGDAAGAAVGTLQATVHRRGPDGTRAAEVAWVVGTPWQRRGYAGEAAQALVAWLADTGATVEAHIAAGHEPSERVAARAGLAPTAETVDGERVWRLP